jgi:hypothetical protein
MRKIIIRIFGISLLAGIELQSLNARGASFSVTTDPKQTCSAIEIAGEIQAGDYNGFVKTLKQAKELAPLRRLYLNSSGETLPRL